MKAQTSTYICVQPETNQETQLLVDYLQEAHCTWSVDEDGTFTIHPVNMEDIQDMLTHIQFL